MNCDQAPIQLAVKDILQPQIPGCLPESKLDNCGRIPSSRADDDAADASRIVRIPLSSLPTYEAAAIYYSYVAYPHRDEATERGKYSIALARWAVLERAKYAPRWKEAEQLIRPLIFSQDEKLFRDTRKRGSRRLWQRCYCAFRMLLPQIEQELLGGLSPTVSNISMIAGEDEGYRGKGSEKTYLTKVWKPVKPVAHAAAAAALYWGSLHDLVDENDAHSELCKKQPFLASLFFENLFRDYILVTAENLRLQVPVCSRFNIKESETLKFVVD